MILIWLRVEVREDLNPVLSRRQDYPEFLHSGGDGCGEIIRENKPRFLIPSVRIKAEVGIGQESPIHRQQNSRFYWAFKHYLP
jgi:hypothetical protein